MKVKELIERLEKFDPEMVVSILDGFNGGGQPREINLTPKLTDIEKLSQNKYIPPECYDVADLPDYEGGDIVVMGYGYY